MTVRELRDHLITLTEGDNGFDKYDVVIREHSSSKTLPLEMYTSTALKDKSFELVTKESIKCQE